MAKILSGERLAKRIVERLKRKKEEGISLAVVQVGENPVSAKYVEEKRKVAKELGVGFRMVALPLNISQTKLEQQIQKTARDPKVSGMIVQLPLSRYLNTQRALDLIPKAKDVDVLSSASFSDFALGTLPILSPTVAAIALLLGETKKNLENSKVVVVGAGRLVGLPTALWLAHQGATISLVQKGTRNAPKIISKADIIISGVGKPGLIIGKMVKRGAVVIDAGTSVAEPVRHRVSNTFKVGKIEGDVDFESVAKKASYLTPVPGGVGPLTVACLFLNLTKLGKVVYNHYARQISYGRVSTSQTSSLKRTSPKERSRRCLRCIRSVR